MRLAKKIPDLSAAILVLFCVLLPFQTKGCGINWAKPTSHFDGVDEQGRVLYSEKLEPVNMGEGYEDIPVFLMFKSNWNNSSPYVGQGWMLPLLESRMEQVDETTFRQWMPDGWFQTYWRDPKYPNLLNGGHGWKASVQSDDITAWADCGWKIVYEKGRIISLTSPKNHTFNWLYSNGKVTAIEDSLSHQQILQVLSDADGTVTGIKAGDKQVSWEMGKRPQVQNVGDKSIVAGTTPSLDKLTFSDRASETFVFSVDDHLYPTLKVNDKRLISWEPMNGTILRDGNWSYTIKHYANSASTVPQTRVNSLGQKEYWFRDDEKGVEIVQGINGIKTITSWFVSGKMAGELRRVEKEFAGTTTVVQQMTYDENARPIRELAANGKITEIKYDKEGNRIDPKIKIPTPGEIQAQEKDFLTKITGKKDPDDTEEARYRLALFYIYTANQRSKAQEVLKNMTAPHDIFTIKLHLIQSDSQLPPSQKVARYTALESEFPDEKPLLDQILKSYNQ